jgi:chitin deacetylase
VLKQQGMRWVQWDIDTDDWQRPPAATIIQRVVTQARPGAVVLMHEGGGDRSHTIAALPVIIAKLKAMGYVFVTLDGLARLPHVMG